MAKGQLGIRTRLQEQLQRLCWYLREYMVFDSRLMRTLLGGAGVACSTVLRLARRDYAALRLETKLHRAGLTAWTDRSVERRVARTKVTDRWLLQRHIEQLSPQPSTKVFFDRPDRLIGTRIVVLKSPRGREKGVLALDYFYVFRLFAKMFNVREIARRYYLLLEPSWSGYCDLDLLCFMGFDFPVFVQNYEPRDIALLNGLSSNLVSISIAANWWVDHRVYRPLPGASRDADVVMIASWARYKRHDAVFSALSRLRSRGERLKVILIGYGGDLSRDELFRSARLHGVQGQLEIYERLSPGEVNEQLNRAKVNLVWSRREGINRAIIEGFLSNTPGILRNGFNYGYDYPYVNAQTGRFSTEQDLPAQLLDVIKNYLSFSPREWILNYMSPQTATLIVDESIGSQAESLNEPWTFGQLAVKISSLDSMCYWDEGDRHRFEDDYVFLRSMLLVC